MARFQEFLQSGAGKNFISQVDSGSSLDGDLQENLTTLYCESADELSSQTLKRTYDPMLEGLFKFVVNGAQVMKQFGVAHRDDFASGQPALLTHSFIAGVATTQDVLNALDAERAYHDTMYDARRETVKRKSPSEQALTVIGLFNDASKFVQSGDTALGLKSLKDAVATGLRVLEEAQQPGSIAEQARSYAKLPDTRKYVVN